MISGIYFRVHPLRAPHVVHLNPSTPTPKTHAELVAAIVGRMRGHGWRPGRTPAELGAETGFSLEEVEAAEAEAREMAGRPDPLRPTDEVM